MKSILEIKENKAKALLALLSDLPYVKIKALTEENNTFLNELKEAVEDVNLIKAGKLTGRPVEELLNEL